MAHIPTLSSVGWEKNLAKKADRLMAYFFISQYSQSYLYRGKIMSLPYIVQQYGKSPSQLQTALNDNLTAYLERYFELSSVDVSYDTSAKKDRYGYEVKVDVVVIDDLGVKYSLGKLIEISNGLSFKIMEINNGS